MKEVDGEGRKGPSNQEPQDGVVDLQAFQAKLEASLGNIQALVDSWIPLELQQKSLNFSSSSLPTFDSYSSRLRNSRLGLGSTKESQKEPTKTDKIQQQIMKNHKKRENPSQTSEERTYKSQAEGENGEEEEESRTMMFNKRRKQTTISLIQEPPTKVTKPSTSKPKPRIDDSSNSNPLITCHPQTISNLTPSGPHIPAPPSCSLNIIANNSASLSKRQIKKLRKLERAKFKFNNTQNSSLNNQSPIHNS